MRPVLARSALRGFLPAALVGAVMFGVACGDDDGAASDTPTASAVASPSATRGPLPPNAIDVGAAEAQFVLQGVDPGDIQVSASALATGDFDADGTPDLVVGASYGDGADESRPDSGEVYVVFDAPSLSGQSNLGEQAGLVVYGAGQEEYAGWSVAAGDVNADGTDDLIIGAPGVTAGDDPRTDQGRVYVIAGGPELRDKGAIDLADGTSYAFVLTGAEGFSRAGHAIAVADINDDGTDDMLIGAPFAGREPGSPPGGPRTGAGALYAVFGSPELTGEVNVAFENPDLVITNDEQYSQFAAAVAAGDLNGDGSEDIVVGAPQIDALGRDGSGSAFVFYGPFEGGVMAWSDAEVVIQGGAAGDALGVQVSAADLNADGRDDVAVSAPQADGRGDSAEVAGDTYVFTDLSGASAVDLATEEAAATLFGRASPDSLGLEMVTADVNGDESPDLIASAPLASVMGGSRTAAGEVVVVFGPVPGGFLEMALGPEGTLSWQGPEPDGQFGVAITALTKGDRPILVLAAARSGSSGPREAKIYGLPVTGP